MKKGVVSSRAFTAFGLPIMGKNSTRVVFEHVIDSKLVPRRVSAQRSEGSAFFQGVLKSRFSGFWSPMDSTGVLKSDFVGRAATSSQ